MTRGKKRFVAQSLLRKIKGYTTMVVDTQHPSGVKNVEVRFHKTFVAAEKDAAERNADGSTKVIDPAVLRRFRAQVGTCKCGNPAFIVTKIDDEFTEFCDTCDENARGGISK